jgi:hypothetical protein
MSQPRVLIVFYSLGGTTEKLALEAAVGSVQARGLIRLRRVPALIPEGPDDPDGGENLVRMNKEYVAPRREDVLWADALIQVMPSYLDLNSREWEDWVALLSDSASGPKVRERIGGVLCPDESKSNAMMDALDRLGFVSDRGDFASALDRGRKLALAVRG